MKLTAGTLFIPATVELRNNDPKLTVHKWFLDFTLTYMNLTDYCFMQSLNVTKLTPEQLEWLAHQLLNYTMVNWNSLSQQIQQVNENYPWPYAYLVNHSNYGMATLVVGIGIMIFLYCKYRHASKTFKNFLQILSLGTIRNGFLWLSKNKDHSNSEDGNEVVITSV